MSKEKPPRSSIPLNNNLKTTIKRIADEQKKRFPDMCIELLEIGISHYTSKEKKDDFLKDIALKNYENILTTLNLVGELVYVAKDEPSKNFKKNQTVKDIFTAIQKGAKESADRRR